MDGQQYILPTPTLSNFKKRICRMAIYEIHVHSDVDRRTRDVRDDSRTERENGRVIKGGVKVTVRPWTCTAGRAGLPGVTVSVLQTERENGSHRFAKLQSPKLSWRFSQHLPRGTTPSKIWL